MINFVCVYKTSPDGIYDTTWIEKLRWGLEKHCTFDFKFYCLTDCKEDFEGKVWLESDSPTWWSKLELFRKDLFKGPTLYFDLDTIICGNIDVIITQLMQQPSFVMVEGRTKKTSSCIMYWNGDYSYLYDQYLENKEEIIKTYVTNERYGDQAYIAENVDYIHLQNIINKRHVGYESQVAKNAKNLRIMLFAKPQNKPYNSASRYAVENWQLQDADYSELVENRRGWLWPKADKFCWKYMRKWPDIPELLSKHVVKKGAVLQAGGNCGFYACKYAELYRRVYTVEPDPVNFHCLLENTRRHGHVWPYRAALGETGDMISLELPHQKNVGTYFVKGKGDIPQITIDGMKIQYLDLIHLDIEGYELFALKGAVKTLEHCQPTVAIEYNKLANKFGYDLNDLDNWFAEMNYKKAAQYDNDIVYVPTK